MPWYRVDGIDSLVHMRGSKLPAPCPHPGSSPGTRGRTCDSPICDRCATEVGPDRHHCPKHPQLSLVLGTNEARTDDAGRASIATPAFAKATAGHPEE